MQRAILNAINKNIWIRAGVLAVVIAVLGWFMLPAELRSAITLQAAYYLGPPLLISLGLGAATLWLTYKWKPTLWVAGCTFASLLLLMAASTRAIPSSTAREDSRSVAQPKEAVKSQPQQNAEGAEAKRRTQGWKDPFADYPVERRP